MSACVIKEIPRDARTARDAQRVHRDRADADLPYLRGSVIVKFKSGTTAGAAVIGHPPGLGRDGGRPLELGRLRHRRDPDG